MSSQMYTPPPLPSTPPPNPNTHHPSIRVVIQATININISTTGAPANGQNPPGSGNDGANGNGDYGDVNGNTNDSANAPNAGPYTESSIQPLTDATDGIEHYDGGNATYENGNTVPFAVTRGNNGSSTASSLLLSSPADSSVGGASSDGSTSSGTDSPVIRTQTDVDGDEEEIHRRTSPYNSPFSLL